MFGLGHISSHCTCLNVYGLLTRNVEGKEYPRSYEEKYETALETLILDTISVMVFRAMLNDNEVTVSFTTIFEPQQAVGAVLTIRYADRQKLDNCFATIKGGDWVLCLDQDPRKSGIRLHHVMK